MFYKSTQFWWPKFHQATKTTLKLCDTCLLLFPYSKEALSSSSPQPLAAALYPRFWLPLHVSCSQGGKKPFNGLEFLLFVMNMLHSLLSSTRFLRLFYSTLSTGIIKTKPPSIFKNSSFSRASPNTLTPPPFFLFCQKPSVRSTGNPSPVLQWKGGGRETPLHPRLACGSGPCAKEKTTSFR